MEILQTCARAVVLAGKDRWAIAVLWRR